MVFHLNRPWPRTGMRSVCDRCGSEVEYWEGHGWSDRASMSCAFSGMDVPRDENGCPMIDAWPDVPHQVTR